MSDTIKLITDYLSHRDRYDNSRKNITRLENELAKAISEPNTTNLDAEPGGGSFSSDKMLNKINRKTEIQLKLNQENELLELYERSYNSIRNEVIELFKEYEEDKRYHSKDKNYFYIFYYRTFKKYVLPFERISEILGISTEWCIKLEKELNGEINKSYTQFSKSS